MSGLLDDVFGGSDVGADSNDTTVSNMAATTSTVSSSATSTTATATTSTASSSAATSSVRSSTTTSTATQNGATPVSSSSSVRSSVTSSAVTSSAVSSSRITSTTSTTTSRRVSSSASSSVTSSRTSSRASSTTSSRKSSSTSTHSSTTSSTSSSTIASSTATSSTSSSASASATVASDSTSDSSSGSSLSTGAIVGIAIGCVAALVLIAILATRTFRKKARADRARRRSSMFEWPAGAGEDPYEKPRYEPPSQSFAMAESRNPQSADYPVESAAQLSYMERHNPQVSYRNSFQPVDLVPSYPPQQGQYSQQQYPDHQQNLAGAGAGAGALAGAAAGGAMAGGASNGRDVAPASWVQVKVGFVRSLEDELPIVPGQKVYLHEIYDDDWSLCEDEQNNKGVVPVSCLQPLQVGGAAVQRTVSGLSSKSQRRESLAPGRQ